MTRTCWVFLLIAFMVPCGWTQSASDWAQKFRHHEVFEIEPGVVMSAQYAPNGLVCEMYVEQTHFKKDVVDLTNGLEQAQIDALLDQLVPASERGEKEEDVFSSLEVFSGPTKARVDTYANVIVHVMSAVETRKKNNVTITGPTVLEIKWRNRPCN